MKELTENRKGWIWPISDTNCWSYMQSHPNLPQHISKHAKQKRVCIQAGGNMGFYVKQYAELFDTVYTFEPEPINFYCMNLNVTSPNVFKYQSCLGNKRDLVALKIKEKNRGKNFVNGTGLIPTLLIDDLNLQVCDLIHLDIEGYELFALQGAMNTIQRCRPTVCIEFFEKCSTRFNYTLDDIEKLMQSLNYKLQTTYQEERVYVPI
jgi:FkbM family methyltransferase